MILREPCGDGDRPLCRNETPQNKATAITIPHPVTREIGQINLDLSFLCVDAVLVEDELACEWTGCMNVDKLVLIRI